MLPRRVPAPFARGAGRGGWAGSALLGLVAAYNRELHAQRGEFARRKDAGDRDGAERARAAIAACHERFRRASAGQPVGGAPRPAGVFCGACLATAPGRGALEGWRHGYGLCAKCGVQHAKSRRCAVCERALTEADTCLIRWARPRAARLLSRSLSLTLSLALSLLSLPLLSLCFFSLSRSLFSLPLLSLCFFAP